MQKEKSLTKNSIYYLIYNVLNVLFPFITGIYVSRVLLPDTIGQVTYAQNIVQYFVIIAFLGIPTYGMREIAKARVEKGKLDKLFSELFIINFISTTVCLLAYLILIFSVPLFRENIELYLIVGLLLLLNYFNISWLYDGLEEFKFTSLRNIIFKAVSFFFLILFVRSQNDILIYACVHVVGTAGNYIINMLRCGSFVHFSFHGLSFKRHLKPIAFLVVVNLAIEIYTLIDVTMLGIFCTNEEVTFYSYASRIQKIFLSIVNSFTMVVVPRLSLLYKEKKLEEFNLLLSNTLKTVIMFAVPIIIGVFFVADIAIVILYGEVYIAAANILKILSVLLFISPIGYLLGSRVMLVTGNEKKMVIAVGTGALINVVCNIIFIQLYHGLGAAIASLISEIIVMVIYVIFGKKYFCLKFSKRSYMSIAIACAVMAFYLFGMSFLQLNMYLQLTLNVMGAIIIYFSVLLIVKEETVFGMAQKLKIRLSKNK